MLLTHHHSICQPPIPTTFTFLLRLFLCLVCSEMITLLMCPMRQLPHPSLPTCRLSPEYCRCVNNSGSCAHLLCSSVRRHVRALALFRVSVGHQFPLRLPRWSSDIPTSDCHHRVRPAPHRLETWQHKVPPFAISYHLSGWTTATATVLTRAPNAYQLPLVCPALHGRDLLSPAIASLALSYYYFRVGSSSQ